MADENIYVIGHKNPDTDSICAPIAYAFYKDKELEVNVIPARVGKINDETKFVLEKFGVEAPIELKSVKGKKLILVDHNEVGQMLDDIDESEVFEVIDHHRLGDLQTSMPILVKIEPVGSSSTIIAELFFYHGTELPKNIAGLMLSGILSDTVVFKSPTTTPKDKEMAEKLAKIVGVDPVQYGIEMKKAGANISKKTANQILTDDYKLVDMGNKKVGTVCVELADITEIFPRKQEILLEMNKILSTQKLDLFFFMVTDILKEGTELFIVGENVEDIIKSVFKKDLKEGSVWMDGVMSRKKQVVPQLREYFTK